jgi:hypothetical protein
MLKGDSKMALILLSGTYAGNINGSSFTGSGTGTIDTDTGLSNGTINYSGFPLTFAAPLCRSWRCKHHQLSTPLSGTSADSSWNTLQTINFSGAASGQIVTAATVSPGSAQGTSTQHSTFNGNYSGPVNVLRVLRYRETYAINNDGTMTLTGVRETEMADGGNVIGEWSGTINVTAGFVAAAAASLLVLNYEFLEFSWQNDGSNASFTKRLRITVDSSTVGPTT